MAEEMDGKDSFIDKIFRHIKAYRDGLSAHILKNRLKHDNDVNEKLEAKKANNLKVNKRLNLVKRVVTHEAPSYDDWCTGRMSKADSKPKNAEEEFQHGWKNESKNGSSTSPGTIEEDFRPRRQNKTSPIQESDESFQNRGEDTSFDTNQAEEDLKPRWKNEMSSPADDENVQVERKNRLKVNSSKFTKIDLQEKKTWYDSFGDVPVKEHDENKPHVWGIKDSANSDSELTGTVKDVENVNPGHLSVIGSLPINFSLTTLDLSLHPELPENIKVIGNDLEKVNEAKLVPARQEAKKKDPKLTTNKVIKCTHCNYSFENIKDEINKTAMAVHMKMKHPEEKKSLKKIMHKMRKRGLAYIRPRFIKLQTNRFKQRITSRVWKDKTSQATETSMKRPKRIKRKNEFIRPGAILPDDIRLGNYIKSSRMSSKKFNSQCGDITIKGGCKQEFTCDAHESLFKLKMISGKVMQILSQSSTISSDWKNEKKIHRGNNGFLNIAINHPRLWREVELISRLVESFNISRSNLWEFKEAIKLSLIHI